MPNTSTTPTVSFDILFNRAINKYVELTLEQQKGAFLTQRHTDFLTYIDKHCYSGYSYKRPTEPTAHIAAQIVHKYQALFV